MKFTILHTESSTAWGGQENRILNEAVGIKSLGVRVIIACQPGSKLSQRAREANIEVRVHPMRTSYDLSAIRFLLKLIRHEKVEVINTHSGKDSFLGAVAGRLSKLSPIIVRTRHLALPITSKFTYSYLPHKVVTVSEHVRQYLIRDEGIKPEKVTTVPTGIDLERFSPVKAEEILRTELRLQRDTPIIGTIAIFRKKKGHHILLEAVPDILKVIPYTVFVFAGNGPEQERIKIKVKEMNLEKHVIFLGLRSDIPDILKSLDIFVLPTLQEAFGTSIIEAMAVEKPVIASRVDGVPEIVKDGLNGILVEPGNPKNLTKAIIQLLQDRDGAERMGIEGRKFVETYYTMDKMVKGMYNLYISLLRDMKNY